MFRRLEILLTVLIMACTVAVLINLVRLNSTLRKADTTIMAAGECLLVGKEVQAVRNDAGTIRKTLVLCLRPGCRFCEESFEFYRRLVTKARNHKGIQIVGATSLPEDLGRSYFRVAGLKVEQVLDMTSNPIGLRGTPTLLLLNDRNLIVRSWEGKLSTKQESEVETTLFESKGD